MTPSPEDVERMIERLLATYTEPDVFGMRREAAAMLKDMLAALSAIGGDK